MDQKNKKKNSYFLALTLLNHFKTLSILFKFLQEIE